MRVSKHKPKKKCRKGKTNEGCNQNLFNMHVEYFGSTLIQLLKYNKLLKYCQLQSLQNCLPVNTFAGYKAYQDLTKHTTNI